MTHRTRNLPSLRPFLPLLLLALLLPASAQAGWSTGLRPLWISVGGAGGGAFGDDAGHGYGTFTLGLRLIPIVPEITLREGVSASEGQVLQHHGNIALGARILLPGLPFLRPNVRVAFSHRHDSPWELFKSKPAGVLFGTIDGIDHRSGFETGGGVELTFGPKAVVGFFVQGTLVVLPQADLPPVTGLVEAGVSFAIGPRRP